MMDEIARKALKLSIRKWENIVDGNGYDDGPRNCELCRKFRDAAENGDDCDGCPVFEETRRRYCERTPYYDWTKFGVTVAKTAEQKAAALKMLQFLKDLDV